MLSAKRVCHVLPVGHIFISEVLKMLARSSLDFLGWRVDCTVDDLAPFSSVVCCPQI